MFTVFILVFMVLSEMLISQPLKETALVLSEGNDTYLKIGLDRLNQEKKAMSILLGWGSLNLVGGSIFALQKNTRNFGYMMAGWGLVNAGIATFALLGADSYSEMTSYQQILKDEQLFNRILAVNSGLNVGYVATGFAMNYLGNTSRTRQFGTAIMIQGAFLMGFDAWLLINSNARLSDLTLLPVLYSFGDAHSLPGIGMILKF